MSDDEIQEMLDDCVSQCERLNDWELKYVDSLVYQFDEGHGMTENQIEKLSEIHSRLVP